MSLFKNAVYSVFGTILNLSFHHDSSFFRRVVFLAPLCFFATWGTPSLNHVIGQSVQRSTVQDGVAFDIPVTAVCYPLADNVPVTAPTAPTTTSPKPASGPSLERADLAHLLTNGPSVQLVSNRNQNENYYVGVNKPAHAGSPSTGSEPAASSRHYAARPSLSEQYQVNSVGRKNRFLLPIDATVVFSDPDLIDTVIFEVFPLSRVWRIDDYAPRSISTTDYAGPISEETKRDSGTGLSGDLKGGIPGYADLSLKVNGSNNSNTLTRQTIKPPHNQIVTSGLTQRGTGVFFKFHRSSEFAIEGGHQLELLMEVDQNWRGDVVQVHCRALDKEGNMFTKDFLMAVTIDGDWQAAQAAQEFAAADRTFQSLLRRWQVKRRPTGFLAEISASLQGDKEPAKPDSVQLARSVFAVRSVEQIPGADQLPQSVRSGLNEMIAAKMNMLQLAR